MFSFSLSYFIPQKWHVYFFFFLHLVVYICTGYAPDSWIAHELYTILISLSLHYLLTTTMTSYLCMISFPAPTVCLLICRQGQYMISHDLTWSHCNIPLQGSYRVGGGGTGIPPQTLKKLWCHNCLNSYNILHNNIVQAESNDSCPKICPEFY